MKDFLKSILRDKTGSFSLRETVVAIFVVVTLIAWMAEQFFYMPIPEYMFYSFVSLIAAGCFGYSIERKSSINSIKNHYEQHDKNQE
jgi:hypothetical protein